MNRNKKDIKLYNVLFPFWMLMLFPQLWLIILPGNFIIDSLVLLISLKLLKIGDRKQWYKTCILKIFIIGMISDIMGSSYMLFMMLVFDVGYMGDELYLTIPGLVIASVWIFLLNYHVTFKKLDKKMRLKLAVIFAVATAPFTFLVPSSWLYY